jgi:GAF domain-containing protein
MSKSALEVAVVFFFLAFLVFVLRQRERYFQYYPQSWRALMLGGILVALTGVTNLTFALSWGESASGLQRMAHVAVIVCYTLGLGLVLVGLATWYRSLVETGKSAARRLRQLTCLKSLLSVGNRHGDLDEILRESLSPLMNIMGYKMGVIFKHTFNASEMALVAHRGVPAERLFTLFDVHSRNRWYREANNSREVVSTTEVTTLPECGTLFDDEEKIRSFACVPIKSCGKVLGLMGLYDSGPDRFSYQEIQFLTALGETLGLMTKQTLLSSRNKKRRDYISAVENVLKSVAQANALEEAFPKISMELGRVVEFDHVSLAVMPESGGNTKRISMGNSGGMLVDTLAGIPARDTALGKVIRSGEVCVDKDIDPKGSSGEDSLFRACGIKSRIILPLRYGASIYGALSLGHKKSNFYSTHDSKWLSMFALQLSHLIWQQRLKDNLKRKESLSRSLNQFENRLAGEENLKTIMEDAATSLISELPKSFARVTLLSKEKRDLITCTTRQIRPEGIDLKKQERFSLDDLPWHRLALEAKRPMLVQQDDPESVMSKREARLIMDEKMNSALLVPLILSGKPVGIVSVGEMRSWDRQPLTEEETAFVKHRATQLCLALKKSVLSRANERLKGRIGYPDRGDEARETRARARAWLSNLSYQINNPLTSIRGSAELLRMKETGLSQDALKYLGNIEHGVQRIQGRFQEFLSWALEKEESKPDQLTKHAVQG